MAKNANSMYGVVLNAISDLSIGESVSIIAPIGKDLNTFRKYLHEISKAHGKKFTTNIKDGNMNIFRIKYSNIHSKELE